MIGAAKAGGLAVLVGIALVAVGLIAALVSTWWLQPCRTDTTTETGATSVGQTVTHRKSDALVSPTTPNGSSHTTTTTDESVKPQMSTSPDKVTTVKRCEPIHVTTGFPLLALVAGGILLVPTLIRAIPEGVSIEMPFFKASRVKGADILSQTTLARDSYQQFLEATAQWDVGTPKDRDS